MDYKIVEFNELTGQITIYVEGFPLFAVDLPIDENQKVPTGVELEQYLKGFIPTWHVERQEKLSKGIANTEEIKALVQPLSIAERPLQDLLLEATSRRNLALLNSDWTQLNDVDLTETEKELWREYRQSLRDITSQEGFPSNIIWPADINIEYR